MVYKGWDDDDETCGMYVLFSHERHRLCAPQNQIRSRCQYVCSPAKSKQFEYILGNSLF